MHEPGLGDRAWWNVHGRRFALATSITASAVVTTGWLTDLRDVMHGALLTFATAALLPFAIIAAGVAVILLTGVFMAVAAACGGDVDPSGPVEGGAGMIEAGARLAPRYYRFLSRRRHPVFWGAFAGALLGGLILWAMLAIRVVPGEARSTDALHEAAARIELHYAQHGTFPEPRDRHLVLDGEIVDDGFGNPLEYRVTGAWKLAAWTLRSTGYDGEHSGDDLCASGGTAAVRHLHAATELLQLARATRPLGERLARVDAMRCQR